MNPHPCSRRTFLRTAAVAAGAAAAGLRAEETGPARPRIRLGAPVFQAPDDPEELARAHRALGYRAAYCPNVALNDGARIRAVSEAFARNDVVLAEVGRWCNLLDGDPEQRRKNLENVTEGLALAEALGARCCVDIAGSFNPEDWAGPHPDNLSPRFFDAAVENARKIIDAVQPKRAKFTYEMMPWALPDSADSCLALIKAVDREGFGVHLDPCNLVNAPAKIYRTADLLNECFDKLGPHIASCHGKDLAWVKGSSVHFEEVRPGLGALDYATFLRRLAALPQEAPLMLEHLPGADEYTAAAAHVVHTAGIAGVGL